MKVINAFYKRISFPFNAYEIIKNKVIDITFFEKYRDVINEVYVNPSWNIQTKDMNGYNQGLLEETEQFIKDIRLLNIKICYTFNDIWLDYDPNINLMGCDIVVVPNTEWLELKSSWPNIEFKNTVINLPTYDDINNGLYDGYDMIYIHDEIIHNHDLYLELKNRRNLKFGTVTNYIDCSTQCAFKDKHYAQIKDDLYGYNTFCATRNYGPVELLLKRNNIPGFLGEYKHYLDVIDIFKLQGRNSTGNFKDAVDIVKNIFNSTELLTEDYSNLNKSLTPMQILKWKINVRNCTGICNECDYCDNILKDIK